MTRPTTGYVFEKPWADGQTISYGARVRAYGRYERVTFGTNKQGWNRTRAELECEKIVQAIERETWIPPRGQERKDRHVEVMSSLVVEIDESFGAFAERWWAAKRMDVRSSTVRDYEWRLCYLRRFFGRFRLGEITPLLVDRFRNELREQAEAIRVAEQRGRGLRERVTDKNGRTYERKRRPLSNTSINAMLKLLGQILQQAVDYDLIERNPVRVGERGARFLPCVRPVRTFLEIDEFHSLLDAGGELEAEARADRKGLGAVRCARRLGSPGSGSRRCSTFAAGRWISSAVASSSWTPRRPPASARSR